MIDHNAAHAASDRLVPRMSLDGALAVGAATQDFVSLLARLGPYGVGNPEPRFVFPAVRVVRADIVGEKHVRCLLVDQQGARLGAIAFRAAGSAVGTALVANAGASLHVAGTVRADEWRGEMRTQLLIEDAAPAYASAAA